MLAYAVAQQEEPPAKEQITAALLGHSVVLPVPSACLHSMIVIPSPVA